MNPAKRCRVCGDHATGFNYNGLCCDSCKVFFHRHAAKFNILKCKHESACTIDIETRSKCRKCRLQKCFQAGMKHDAYQLAQWHQKRVQAKVHNSENSLNNSYSFFDKLFSTNVLVKLLQESNGTGSLPVVVANPTTTTRRRCALKLSQYESIRLNEVQHAVEAFIDEKQLHVIGSSTSFYDEISVTEVYVKMVVQFCARIPAFSSLGKHDQFVLLKTFCYDVLTIRYAFVFDFEHDGIPVVRDLNSSDALFISYKRIWDCFKHDLVRENYEFIKELQDEMENDFVIRDLFSAYAMFKPFDSVAYPEFFRYHCVTYSRLLRRYLEHKYKNVQQANRKCAKLMHLLGTFHRFKQNERVMVRHMDASKIPQIWFEVFDLVQ